MAGQWTPTDVQRLMVLCSVSFCLVILTGCISIGVITGKIGSNAIGTVGAAGTGLAGLATVLYWIIKTTLPQQAAQGASSNGN
jgi:hypothetical protein